VNEEIDSKLKNKKTYDYRGFVRMIGLPNIASHHRDPITHKKTPTFVEV
jgi:hypothetical protein